MKLRVTFVVDDKEWGPINGYLLDKVANMEVTNAVAIKAAANPQVARGSAARVMEVIQQRKGGVSGREIYDFYEGLGATRTAAYQTLVRLKKQKLVSALSDGRYRATAKGMKS